MKGIAIYCGSSSGFDPVYATAVEALGEVLVDRKLKMIYGAGSVGLMGVIADKIMKNGGEVTGIIPQFLMDLEVGHKKITKLEVVEDMHVRKARMIELSDGFIAMPGGFGTLDEIFEVLTWGQLGLHSKPIGFYNINGYYDSLFQCINHMVEKGFLKAQYVEDIIVSSDPSDLIKKMTNNISSRNTGKWIS